MDKYDGRQEKAEYTFRINPIEYTGYFDVKAEQGRTWIITTRDIGRYLNLPSMNINPSLQYLEVGAGLGEFTPLVVRSNPRHRPIVIDPANYPLMLKMLKSAYNRDLKEELKERIRILQERCEIILNPAKVNLINLTLEEALAQHPELEGIADVVVDNFGAIHYSSETKERRKQSIALERRLSRSGKRVYIY
ncbi:MAG: hypothetical protein AABX05_03155 [Nanoarchaeota archaeon]